MRCEICGFDPCETPGFCESARRADAAKINTNWIGLCVMSDGKSPKPLPIVENAYVALANDPKLTTAYRFDAMLRKPMLVNSGPRPVTDDDTIDLQRYLQRAGLKRISRDTTFDAVCNYAMDHQYHPIRDWLEELEWDGVERLSRWLEHYLGAEDNDYTQTIGRLFLISMVARIMRPGCKADHMLILEGPQGILKSTVCRVLAGDEYFSDNMPDLSLGKECSIHLAGRWLLEIPEMHAFSRVDATRLKSFMSTDVERYRPVYARADVDEPRQCVFIGTSNKESYLRDETGGRRFWPVKCGKIDIEALRSDRAAILAEAMAAFQAGEPWWPSPEFQASHIGPEQEKRFEFDEWDNAIADYLHASTFDEITTAQVAKGALSIEGGKLDMLTQKRVAAIMYRHGWIRRVANSRRSWQRPPSASPPPDDDTSY